MICCGVPRTLPSGPELSKTRLMMFPPEGRLLRFLFRDRDFDDLMNVLSSSLWAYCFTHELACTACPLRCGGDLSRELRSGVHPSDAQGIAISDQVPQPFITNYGYFRRNLGQSARFSRFMPKNHAISSVQIAANPHACESCVLHH